MSRPPLVVRRASPRAAAWALRVLWRFGRPHTLIGTSLSIVGLYVIAASLDRASSAVDLLWTLLAGLCVNVFITGINQIEDVEIDRLNKPWLPIAAGDLSLDAARRIVAAAAIAPVLMAVTQGVAETVAVGVGARHRLGLLVPPAAAQALPGAGRGLDHLRALAGGQPRRMAPLRGHAGQRGRVGAHRGDRALLVRHRRAQGRARHRGRPALRDRHLLRAPRAPPGAGRRRRRPHPRRAGDGDRRAAAPRRRQRGRARGRAPPRPGRAVALGAARRPRRPARLRRLLPARVAALLLRVPARPARLRRRL